jgi:hypothetical protein
MSRLVPPRGLWVIKPTRYVIISTYEIRMYTPSGSWARTPGGVSFVPTRSDSVAIMS